jgi:hypothetical protein
VRRHAAALLLGLGALLVVPGAAGLPDVPGDPTPPVVTPVITGTQGDAGWYTTNVTVNWSISDPESIILSTSGCNTITLTANTAGTQLTCTAESDGGITTVSKTFKVDKTDPAVTAAPSRSADSNGWYNHELSVGFSATDGTSGVVSCSPSQAYGGPDSVAASVSGTCRDQAGNVGQGALPIKYDETAPQASGSARAPDANGWFNHAVTVTYSGADGTSGIDDCSQQTYSGPDDPSVSLTGTCRDLAGNVSPSASFGLKYDETAPTATASPSRQADVNGWHNHVLTVSFTGSDATSGLASCDPPQSYSGPDSATASVSGSCRDQAGNVAPRAFAFKYDDTAPSTTATPSRQPNAAGWYREALTVGFAATDATSGVASCLGPQGYSGPDGATAAVNGSCADQAGNVGATSFPLKYDGTAPQASASARAPDSNGWYNHALPVSFSGTDATSGIASCDAAATYSTPDSAAASVSGDCVDRAGNPSNTATFGFKYDATAPATTATPSRQPNAAGWYRAPLNVGFGATDGLSGVASCDAAKSYSGPDAASASVSGACRDTAGNEDAASYALKYDATAPAASATPSRQPNAAGWFNASLSVSYSATDALSGFASCDPAETYSGPDTLSTSVSGACLDNAGNPATAAYTLKFDATRPGATASPTRVADANGWYNHALPVGFSGTDAISGVADCDAPKTYSAPDSATASISGTCLDRAGNQSLPASAVFKYDATPPVTTATPSRQPNAAGWYRTALSVGFGATDGLSGVASCDAAKSYSGPDAASASVSGACRDTAGNEDAASYALKYDATAPAASATPSRQPNAAGWFNASLSVSYSATDALSGFASCDPAETYSGPDTLSTSVSGACLDNAGNPATAAYTLKFDATRPGATASPTRVADANGWYNHALPVGFSGTDAISGVADCDAPKTYSAPDSATASISGTCLDRAGNQSLPASAVFKYDATPPVTTATPSRQPDRNGWYRAPLNVGFTGGDATSGVQSCDAQKSYAGPDAAAAAVAGACRDLAGNSGATSYALKYDSTGPAASATASRAPNAAGWFNAPLSVSFSATDTLSGLEACPAATPYGGPDAVLAVVSGTCSDKAGNETTASLGVKYDATPPTAQGVPSRQPNANGWFNAAFGVSYQGTDPTSGIATCTAQNYSGPDSASGSLSGTCRDAAGNDSAPAAFAFKYDATAPTVDSAAPVRAPDRAGWYNRAVSFGFQGTDATSGIGSCPAVTYGGPDAAAASIVGACLDRAGNRTTRAFPLKYDGSGPVTTARADRGPDANGWYNRPLTVSFSGVDSVSGVESCSGSEQYQGPDGAEALLGGVCMDKAGNAGLASLPVSYDATPPAVTGVAPSRQPDANGWYNRPVLVSFQGADATSQIDACTQVSYAGPDSTAAGVSGFCRDRAGNTSGSRAFGLRFDSTAPALGELHAKPGNGFTELTWTTSPDTALVEIRRGTTLVYSGTGTSFTDRALRNGVLYRYSLAALDEAGNRAIGAIGARPMGPLVAPLTGAVVSAPPRLAWKPVANATYYNVQLWRNGRILSVWPRTTFLRLHRTWKYDGRRYKLTKGRYRWYVWPGFGKRSERRFGKLLGSSSFVVR